MPPWRRFAKCRVAHANRSFHKFGVLYLGVLKKGSYYLGYYTRVPYFRKLPNPTNLAQLELRIGVCLGRVWESKSHSLNYTITIAQNPQNTIGNYFGPNINLNSYTSVLSECHCRWRLGSCGGTYWKGYSCSCQQCLSRRDSQVCWRS